MSKRNDVTAGETALRCGVDSDALMTLRLAVIEFLCSFRAAYVAIARGVYSVTCPDGTSQAGAIPAISNRKRLACCQSCPVATAQGESPSEPGQSDWILTAGPRSQEGGSGSDFYSCGQSPRVRHS